MLSVIISRVIILVFGTLYPAYASYKAIKTKNVKEYVKWMMYWIVFAFFSCAETFADLFISWFPFYYEFKIVFVLWLLSPATKGSSVLYRKFVHPQLTKREAEIDAYIAKASEQGYHTALRLGSRGISFASDFVLKAAVKGQATLTDHLKRSYSLNDLSDDPMELEPPTLAPVTSASSMPASTDDTDNRLMGGERFDKDLPDKDLTPLLTSPEKSSGTRLSHRHTPTAASSNLPEKSTDDAAKRTSRRTTKDVKEVPPRSMRPTTRKSKLATGDVLL